MTSDHPEKRSGRQVLDVSRVHSPEPVLVSSEPSLIAREALDRVRRMGDGRTGFRAHNGSSVAATGLSAPAGPTYSRAGIDERDPHELGEELKQVTQKFGWRTQLDVGALLGNWPGLVGPDVAAHCTPEVCEPPRLVVRASSTTWATQLRIMSSTLLDRLERELGRRVIDDIEILGPVQRSWKKGRRSVRGRGPRDTYG